MGKLCWCTKEKRHFDHWVPYGVPIQQLSSHRVNSLSLKGHLYIIIKMDNWCLSLRSVFHSHFTVSIYVNHKMDTLNRVDCKQTAIFNFFLIQGLSRRVRTLNSNLFSSSLTKDNRISMQTTGNNLHKFQFLNIWMKLPCMLRQNILCILDSRIGLLSCLCRISFLRSYVSLAFYVSKYTYRIYSIKRPRRLF